ncbi:MAG TPA: hypothetical protein VFY69_09550 [Solirubrobacterales bacterium]|nr:hypothetical protein [Solirubrobacterales bacterium]
MRRFRRLLLAALLAVAAVPAGGFSEVASADDPLGIRNLQVNGGEEGWRPERSFRLTWGLAQDSPATPSAVAHRLYDGSGIPVGPPITVSDEIDAPLDIVVPPVPGIYEIEVWFLDADGNAGPRATAMLRFDNVAPPAPHLEAPAHWLLGTEPAILRIDVSALPHPPSGIRGYAVSLNHGVGSFEAEASGEDTVSLGTLPEGTNVVRVAAISGAGLRSEAATATFRVDATRPELSLQGVPSGWSNEPVQVTAHARDALSGMAPSGPTGPFTAIGVDGGAPTLAWGDQVGAWVTGSGVHEVELSGRDAAGNVAGAEAQPPQAPAIVRIDEDPPKVAFVPAQDSSEPERLEATVTDALSGPSPSRGSIALRPAGTNARYQELPTEVVAGRLIARWDSDAFPHGKYEFIASGFDIAGNLGTGTARDRGARMVLVNPVKAQASLESGFAVRGRGWQAAKRVRLGRGVRFGGRLRRLGGGPVAGQEITVTETFGTGAEPRQRATTVRTGADGAFSLRLAPGPSREVVATYAGSRALTRTTGESANLTTLAATRLRASAATARVGGRPIAFSGRVAAVGAKRAVRGLPVELQFRYPGAGWRAFRTVEADARGRFRYAYRFSDDDSRGVRFQFRAYVKGREGWPYEPSASRPVQVTGR